MTTKLTVSEGMKTIMCVRRHGTVNQQKAYWPTEVHNTKRLCLQAANMHFGGCFLF